MNAEGIERRKIIMRRCAFLDTGKRINTGHMTELHWCDYLKRHVSIRGECRKCTVQEWVEVD